MSTLSVIEFSYGDAVSDSQSLSKVTVPQITEEQQAFLDLFLTGMPVDKCLETRGITQYRYAKWRAEMPAFEHALRSARAIVIDQRVDLMDHVARTEPDVNRARLIIDTQRWLASKLIPKVYGEKLDINVTQTIDIGSALAEARSRSQLRPTCDPADIIDVQVIDSQDNQHAQQIDNESTPPLPDIFD
jgi:hypothetical protein